MIDSREAILTQVSLVLKAIDGTGTYTNDVGGRVYSKQRGVAKADATDCPYLEVLTSAKTADSPRILDDNYYADDLHIEIAGYVKSPDAGDDFDAAQRPLLNALRADVVMAMRNLPTYSDAGNPTLRQRYGVSAAIMTSQWTEPSSETSDGYFLMEYLVPYIFDERTP